MAGSGCSVDECSRPHKARGLCSRHYARDRKGKPMSRPCRACGAGDVDTLHGFHAACRPTVCVMCKQRPVAKPHSDVCSFRCRALLKRGARQSVKCNRCGDEIDLWAEGRHKRSDTILCDRCRAARHTRHKVSISALAKAWGTNCNICGEAIDLSLKAPDQFRASVDHEVPYSLGGSNDPENLRLAHLWCNQVKHNRQGFRI